MLARLYQLEQKFNKALPAAEAMLKAVPTFRRLTQEQQANQTYVARHLALNSIRSLAYLQFKDANHARVAGLLNPKIEEMKKEFAEAAKEDLTLPLKRLRQTQRDTLLLALQSSVLDQKIDRAGELLELLGKSGGAAESSGMLRSLVATVRGQIDELEKA